MDCVGKGGIGGRVNTRPVGRAKKDKGGRGGSASLVTARTGSMSGGVGTLLEVDGDLDKLLRISVGLRLNGLSSITSESGSVRFDDVRVVDATIMPDGKVRGGLSWHSSDLPISRAASNDGVGSVYVSARSGSISGSSRQDVSAQVSIDLSYSLVLQSEPCSSKLGPELRDSRYADDKGPSTL